MNVKCPSFFSLTSNALMSNRFYPLVFDHLSSRSLVRQHIDSFNYFITTDIRNIVLANSVVDSDVCSNFYLKYLNVYVERPVVSLQDGTSRTSLLYPNECRLRDSSYMGSCYVDVEYTKNKQVLVAKRVFIGRIPIMLRSVKCHLSSDQGEKNAKKTSRNVSDPPTSNDLNFSLNAHTKRKVSGSKDENTKDKMKDFELPLIESNNMRDSNFYKRDECPLDPGGYFIINGVERVVLIQEQLSKNRIILENAKGLHMASVTSSTAERKSKTIVFLNPKTSEVQVRANCFTEDLPLTVVCRCFGMHSDYEIARNVGFDLSELLEPSLEAGVKANVFDSESALLYVGSRVRNRGADLVQAARHAVCEVLLPNVETEGVDCRSKAICLCLMTRRVLLSACCQLQTGSASIVGTENNSDEDFDHDTKKLSVESFNSTDDKDFVGSKRCELAGTLLGLLFEDAFKRFNTELKRVADRALLKRAAAQAFDAVQALRLQSNLLEVQFQRAISTGNWVLKRFRMDRAGVTQVLPRLSHVSALGCLARVSAQFERSRKVSGPRALHMSQWGFFCPADTPEGESCGLVKSLALLADVTVDGDQSIVTDISHQLGVRPIYLLSISSKTGKTKPPTTNNSGTYTTSSRGYKSVVNISGSGNSALTSDNKENHNYNTNKSAPLCSVFVNGGIVGEVLNPERFATAFRALRRTGKIQRHVSIATNSETNAVHIATDGGRIIRPLILIKKFIIIYDKDSRTQVKNDTSIFGNSRSSNSNTCLKNTLDAKSLKFGYRNPILKKSLEKCSPDPKDSYLDESPQTSTQPRNFYHQEENTSDSENAKSKNIHSPILISASTDFESGDGSHVIEFKKFKHLYYDSYDNYKPYIETDSETQETRTVIFAPAVTDRDIEFVKRKIKSFNHLINEGKIEYIDCNESSDTFIAISPNDITPETTHMEMIPFAILGTVSATIPFPDHNQSPRNTYQCAMGKQAMGYIATNIKKRFDTLQYILTYSGKPLVKSHVIDLINYEQLPAGQNAMVAVMSFTGYDIEDALIINKDAIDRGYGRCEVYKSTTSVLKKYLNGTSDRVVRNDSIMVQNTVHNGTDFFTPQKQHGFDSKQTSKEIINTNVFTIHNSNKKTNMLDVQISQRNMHSINLNAQATNYSKELLEKQKNLNGGPQETQQHDDIPFHENRCQIKNLVQNKNITDKTSSMTFLQYKHAALEGDGITAPGTVLSESQIYVNMESPSQSKTHKFSGQIYKNKISKSIVDKVLLTRNGEDNMIIKTNLRQTRIPEIGDKFSSRHGQKGVVGLIVNQADMPFNEYGQSPDMIMNPHGFPSRMTVGKILELVCGKSAVCTGKQIYSTPFLPFSPDPNSEIPLGCDINNTSIGSLHADKPNHEKCEITVHMSRAETTNHKYHDVEDGGKVDINYIKNNLVANGFSYCGKDIFYSGSSGNMLTAYIYYGPIYYQKLKHMVSDKMHARATGPKTALTRQPTEGRARDGGLRLGEMERDCLIGYGASQLLVERLLTSSDLFIAQICRQCGIICIHKCNMCGTEDIAKVKIPYACKLLFQELIAMNILPRIKLKK